MPDHPFTRWGPPEQWTGLKAATFDPRIPQNATALSTGVISLFEVVVPESFLCSKIHAAISTTAGVGLANSFAGIYDDQGNLVGQSADQSSSWQSTGAKEVSLITPVMLQGQRRYYVALLIGTAGTQPTWARAGNLASANAGVGAPFRAATTGSGLSALPSSIALAGVSASFQALWVGLS
jgi:hypothetical protein